MLIGSHPLFNPTNIKEIQELLDTLNENSKKSSEKPNATPLPSSEEAKTKTLGTLVESLLKNAAQNDSVKQNLFATLKSSHLTKNIENTTQTLQTIVKNIQNDEVLQKYVPKLEQFSVDIKNIDVNNIKSQIQNSGVFLESKIAMQDSKSVPVPLFLKDILGELQAKLTELLPQKTNTEQLSTQIKIFIADVKNSPNLNDAIMSDIKKVFSSVIKDFKIDKTLLQDFSKIQNALTFAKQTDLSQNLQTIKTALITNTNEAIYTNKIQNIQSSFEMLNKPAAVFSNQSIESLQSVINQVKALPVKNLPLIENILKVALHVNDVSMSESKIQNELPVQNFEKLQTKIKDVLNDLKLNIAALPHTNQIPQKSVDTITKMIDTLITKFFSSHTEKTPEIPLPQISTKLNPSLPLSNELTKLLNVLQTELKTFEPKTMVGLDVHKNIAQIEKVLAKEVQNFNIALKQNALPLKEKLEVDIKATLLHLKDELAQSSAPHHKELSLHVQKALTNIEYYQLNSYITNQSSVYLPFSWQDLKKGEVHFKKLKENRYFCEIDIELKDYGKIDMMLMLFNDININLSIFCENEAFLERFRQNIKELRVGMNNLGLVPANIQMYNATKDAKIQKIAREFVTNEQMDMGVNIKV